MPAVKKTSAETQSTGESDTSNPALAAKLSVDTEKIKQSLANHPEAEKIAGVVIGSSRRKISVKPGGQIAQGKNTPETKERPATSPEQNQETTPEAESLDDQSTEPGVADDKPPHGELSKQKETADDSINASLDGEEETTETEVESEAASGFAEALGGKTTGDIAHNKALQRQLYQRQRGTEQLKQQQEDITNDDSEEAEDSEEEAEETANEDDDSSEEDETTDDEGDEDEEATTEESEEAGSGEEAPSEEKSGGEDESAEEPDKEEGEKGDWQKKDQLQAQQADQMAAGDDKEKPAEGADDEADKEKEDEAGSGAPEQAEKTAPKADAGGADAGGSPMKGGFIETLKRIPKGKACTCTGCIGTLFRLFLDWVAAFYVYVALDLLWGEDNTDRCFSCASCCSCLSQLIVLLLPILIPIGIMLYIGTVLNNIIDFDAIFDTITQQF